MIRRHSERRNATLWSLAGDGMLSDGEWHDGLAVTKAIARAVPPGVAERKAESLRSHVSELRHGTANERIITKDLGTLIRIGQRTIARSLVGNRLREGSWEIEGNTSRSRWRVGGWRLRDLRVGRITVTDAASKFQISKPVVIELIQRDPPLEHLKVGRVVYLIDIDGLRDRLEDYRNESLQRRRAAARKVSVQRQLTPRPGVPLTELATRSKIGGPVARKLQLATPELGWIEQGRRNRYLPPDRVPEWDKAVQLYRDGDSERRSVTSKRVRAARTAALERAAAAPQAEETPAEGAPAEGDGG